MCETGKEDRWKDKSHKGASVTSKFNFAGWNWEKALHLLPSSVLWMTRVKNPPMLLSKTQRDLNQSWTVGKCEIGFIKSCPVFVVLPTGSKPAWACYWNVTFWDLSREKWQKTLSPCCNDLFYINVADNPSASRSFRVYYDSSWRRELYIIWDSDDTEEQFRYFLQYKL